MSAIDTHRAEDEMENGVEGVVVHGWRGKGDRAAEGEEEEGEEEERRLR